MLPTVNPPTRKYDRARIRVDRDGAQFLYDLLRDEEADLLIIRHELKLDDRPFIEQQHEIKIIRDILMDLERVLGNWPTG